MVKFFRVFSALMLILWMYLIFSLSAETAAESSQTSGGIIQAIIKIFYADFENISLSHQQNIISALQFIVRKTAHFCIYAVLGLLSFLCFVTYKRPSLVIRSSISSFVCLAYAISDEVHQHFIAGRSGEIRNVLIDFCGSLIAIIFLYLITRMIANKKTGGVCKMRKKDLIKLNEDLFLRNEENLKIIESLKQEIEELKHEKEEKTEICTQEAYEEPIEEETETETEETVILPDDTSYGASVIGKIVVLATENCNKLSLNDSTQKSRDQINLILGRTEVAKAEILKIITQNISLERKIELMDTEKNEVSDYFESVMAQ